MLLGQVTGSPQFCDILDTILPNLLRVQTDLSRASIPTPLQSPEHKRARLSPRHTSNERSDHLLHNTSLLDLAGGEGQDVWDNGDLAIPHRCDDDVLLLELIIRGVLSKAPRDQI